MERPPETRDAPQVASTPANADRPWRGYRLNRCCLRRQHLISNANGSDSCQRCSARCCGGAEAPSLKPQAPSQGRSAEALWRRTQRSELSGQEAKERLTELFNAPVTTTTIENDLLSAADLANVLGHPVLDCLYLAMASREDTYVVAADSRFHTVVDQATTLRGAGRLLGA